MTGERLLQSTAEPINPAAAARTDLKQLAEEANRQHKLSREAAVSAVEHAIQAGEYLIRAKELVPYGEWIKWVNANMDCDRSMVKVYIRLARHREEIGAAPSISGALDMLKQERTVYDPAVAKQVVAAVKAGEKQKVVAERFGISQPTVSIWCNPEKERARHHKRRRETQDARKALERQRTAQEAKRVKGSIADAYSLIRKALQVLDSAAQEAHNDQARAAAFAAMRSLHNAEDKIGEAIRTWDIDPAYRERTAA